MSELNGKLNEQKSTFRTKVGLAEMLKGGVIMDVVTPEQAIIAEEAGACAVMALERVPSDIRKEGGVARMTSLRLITEIQKAVTIPVMAKCRIGHFVEAQILQQLKYGQYSPARRHSVKPARQFEQRCVSGWVGVDTFG